MTLLSLNYRYEDSEGASDVVDDDEEEEEEGDEDDDEDAEDAAEDAEKGAFYSSLKFSRTHLLADELLPSRCPSYVISLRKCP